MTPGRDMESRGLADYFAGLLKKWSLPPLLEKFREESVISDGLKIHLDVHEKNKGAPTVVFIPGTSVYALVYVEILSAIGDLGYNIVALDPRGHGRSEGARGDYTMTEIVRDAQAAVGYARDTFGPSVTVMGSSQGGIAAFYAAAADSRLASAICHNIADLTDPGTIRLTRHPAFSRLIKPLLPWVARVSPMTNVPIPLYLDLNKEHIRGFGNAWDFIRQDPLALRSIRLRALASLVSTALPRPVEEITTPILVLHSEFDNIFPADYVEKIFARLTCRKRLVNLRGLPHLITIEHVKEVMPAIAAWLTDIHG